MKEDVPLVSPHKAPCSAMMRNTFDPFVAVDDTVAAPAGCVAIIDAEHDLVCYAPRETASAIVAWLNWSDEHAPPHYDACETKGTP